MSVISEYDVRDKIKKGRVVLIHSDQVYDVTDFADRHPGGKNYLEEHAGKDVTEVMKHDVPHSHSQAAYTILNKYHIGSYVQENGYIKHRNGYKNGTTKISNGVANGSAKTNGHAVEPQDKLKDDLIDWSRPIFSQVGLLGDNYYQWVHQPIDFHIRLFESDFYEFFSSCPWWLVPIVWVPVLLSLLFMSYNLISEGSCVWMATISKDVTISIPITVNMMPLLFTVGVLLWTLDEYVIHRWLFHLRPPSNYPFIIKMHFLFHGQHHKSPMDKMRLVFPPVPATVLAFIVYSLYAIFVPTAMALSLFAGTITGYIAYDLVHYYLHHGVPYGSYFKSLKKYHVKHHYLDHMNGFGISSKMWDYPFGTVIPDC